MNKLSRLDNLPFLRLRSPASKLLGLAFVMLTLAGMAAFAEKEDASDLSEIEVPRYERLEQFPFRDGEKIFYNLRWSVFDVGEAVMEFSGPVEWEGQRCWQVSLTARTNGFADKIFKVRDYNVVWVDEDFTHPVHYIKNQKEGHTDREVVVRFDWEKNTAQYTNRADAREPIEVLPGSWDPLGITYHVRNLKTDGLTHFSIPSTDGKKCTMTEIDISGPLDVKVPAGKYEVILLEPDTKDLGGVFSKSEKAGIKIWFSNDGRHIPVKMASKVVVGSFVAEMTRIEGPGAEAYSPKEDEDSAEGDSPKPRRRGR